MEDICLFAQTNYRNQMRRFGIKTDDRRRHMYVIGKTHGQDDNDGKHGFA